MIRAFWPGPLTLVLNCKNNAVSSLVNGGQNSIAIRAPKHDLTQQLLRQLNRPLVAPSANPFGQISPTTAKHVAISFPDENFLILDGGRCGVGIESTIIQVTDHDGYHVLRPGMIDLQTIERQFGQQGSLNLSAPRVSGQLETHYQPKKKLYYIEDWRQVDNYSHLLTGKIYTLSISEHMPTDRDLHHQLPNDAQIVAYELYDELRNADQSQADIIVIELPPNQIKWHAIREKIIKAGQRIDTI
jgi:L-threonylcarbamoyladenylate synthase